MGFQPAYSGGTIKPQTIKDIVGKARGLRTALFDYPGMAGTDEQRDNEAADLLHLENVLDDFVRKYRDA